MTPDDHDTLIRVHSLLEALTSEVRASNTNMNQLIADHEARIRALEKTVELARGKTNGALSNRRTIIETLGVVISATIAFLTYHLGKIH